MKFLARLIALSGLSFALIWFTQWRKASSADEPIAASAAVSEAPTSSPTPALVSSIDSAPNAVAKVEASAAAKENSEGEIRRLGEEIAWRERELDRRGVIEHLNRGDVGPEQRQVFYDMINELAAARTRRIELRLRHLEARFGGAMEVGR